MAVCFFISGFYLSNDRQNIYRFDIRHFHRLIIQRLDGQVVNLHFRGAAVLSFHREDDGTGAGVLGGEVMRVGDFCALPVLLYLRLHKGGAADEGQADEKVGRQVHLKHADGRRSHDGGVGDRDVTARRLAGLVLDTERERSLLTQLVSEGERDAVERQADGLHLRAWRGPPRNLLAADEQRAVLLLHGLGAAEHGHL